MTRLLRYLVLGALTGVAIPAVASPVAAQQVGSQPPAAPRWAAERGWVGVSVNVLASQSTNGVVSTSVTVTDVSDDSPAARAGIRSGDVILSINGARSFPSDLRAGDRVHVTLQRAGRTREVDLTASPRPLEAEVRVRAPFTVHADSMVDRMYHAMDSIRVRLARVGNDVAGENVPGFPPSLPSPGAAEPFAPGEIHPPFGFYIFRGEAHDSLRQAMDNLNEHFRELRIRQATRVRELTSAAQGGQDRIDASDPELRRIDMAMADANRRAIELRDAMEQAASREAFSPHGVVVGRATAAEDARGAPAGFRPLDPYLLGQNRAAGAEFVDLRPELAEYFGVAAGVLVVDVAEHTPAAQAGIQPGDVLVDIGLTPVRSIEEVRVRLAGASAQTPVTVVRKGKRLKLMLRP